ncbi:MAG: DNA recombination/repair protein RecA, partial [Candidatus Tectomicrobia bacterium]|nr:DNA recombination/repair protein RecA [Candidatus Tectomicrobia bacterium]
GVSKEGDIIDLGTLTGIIKKQGAFFSYGETRLGQGRENAKAFLKKNIEISQEIAKKIKSGSISPSLAHEEPLEEE